MHHFDMESQMKKFRFVIQLGGSKGSIEVVIEARMVGDAQRIVKAQYPTAAGHIFCNEIR